MKMKELSLDELLELVELKNLPDTQEQSEGMYYAYLRTKLDTIIAYNAKANAMTTVTAAVE